MVIPGDNKVCIAFDRTGKKYIVRWIFANDLWFPLTRRSLRVLAKMQYKLLNVFVYYRKGLLYLGVL
ncbi:MAG: hypothetical protein A2074_04615 [Candidatus Aquicultor primus]|uniref:Uncharacterized protein n=1 Tax=Candidatus Aquicultor primus TaxID=1797195 RepID=A0A1F2UIF4_9ACTN|nr:MAG: hypothetical protein A2074_04615 [Candidatus Aquicultor primus]